MPGGLLSRPRSRTRRGGRAALAVAACVAAAGCAALLRPFDHGPSGLSRWDESLRRLSVSGRFDSALALTGPEAADAGDDLLRLEYEGLAARYAGDLERSRLALEAAGRLAEDRYTRSLARMVLSFVSSDRTRAYEPPLTDRLFVHYYGALDYLEGADLDGAAVEARRIEQELALADGDLKEDPAVRSLAATLHAFAGAVFEATGRPDEAAVAYRLARRAGADSALAPDPPPAAGGRGGAGDPATRGTVLVAVEEGFVAHRVQRSLTVPVWPEEAAAIGTARASRAEGDGEPGDAVALRVARRGLGLEPGRRKGPRLRDDGGDRGDPYLLRVAWPEYAGGLVPDAPVSVRLTGGRDADGATPAARTDLRAEGAGEGGGVGRPAAAASADITSAVRAEFRREAPGILARTLARALAKRAAVEAVKKTVSEKDEDLGQVAGLAANVVTALLEQADTRGWNLLPARVSLVRTRAPAGERRLTVRVAGPGGAPGAEVELGPVRVPAGGVVVVATRVWKRGAGTGP